MQIERSVIHTPGRPDPRVLAQAQDLRHSAYRDIANTLKISEEKHHE